MNIFQQIEHMHQQVREFVEKEYPGFKVISVDNYCSTVYAEPMHALLETPDFILAEVKARFRTRSREITGIMRLDCEVFVTNEGKLFTANPAMSY